MNTNVSMTKSRSQIGYWGNLFLKLLSNIEYGRVQLTGPEGEVFQFRGSVCDKDEVDLKIYDWTFCEYIFTKGDIGLGESYIEGLWSSSDIPAIINFGILNEKSLARVLRGSIFKIIFYRIKHLLNRNTVDGSRKNIHAHYDLGNDFYKLWLDKSMTYSSACFVDGDNDLYNAQQRKYEKIFDQLDFKEGDHILEIGCGWGGFAAYACSRGAKVTGITISEEQYIYAKNNLRSFGDRATILMKDYRKLNGQFDHIVSIEMFEALGQEYWDTYFKGIYKLLRPGGKAVIQTITIKDDVFKSYRKGTDFIQQYIFPGGMLPSVEIFTKRSQRQKIKILNRFDFGLDYATTLNQWCENFQDQLSEVRALGFDERFIKTWRFYLKYCEGGFKSGRIGVSQFTLVNNNEK